MKDAACLSKYEAYLKDEKNASANTLSSYLRDIRQLGSYLSQHGGQSFDTAAETDLSAYIGRQKGSSNSVFLQYKALLDDDGDNASERGMSHGG